MNRFRPSSALVLSVLLVGALVPLSTHAAENSAVLFRDVRVFDGVDSDLTAGDVLVVGNKISKIAPGGGIEVPAGAVIIEGNKRILSPGFIDIHAHLTISLPVNRLSDHPWVVGAMTGVAARSYLDQGFTTVRDAGGTHPDIARAVDEGLFPGPHIYPSGAMLTQTSGHGDFRDKNAPHPTLCNCGSSHFLQHGMSVIADGVPQWLAAVREDLKHGATQIKIMGAAASLRTTTRSTRCNPLPKRSARPFRRPATGVPTSWPTPTPARPCSAWSTTA